MLPKFLTKKRIALLLVVSCLLFVVAAKPLFAFSSQGFPGYHLSFENAVFVNPEMNLQSFVFETMKASISSMIAMIHCFTCPREPGAGTGLLDIVGSLIAGIYANPPASGVEYLAYMGQKLNLASPAYAQGVGFTEMQPYLLIWTKFRDLSYGLFVIIFIFIGFAIMFRVKISPQAIVTIESALPKLIFALLLVTFSYAVVGFLIDIMMVISNLIIFTFRSLLPGSNIPDAIASLIPGGTITDAGRIFITILIVGIPPILFSLLALGILGGIGIGLSVGATLISGGAGTPVAILGGVGLGIAALILAIVFVIALIRVLWILLKAYVMVVLNLIFAPFIIIVGALPGSNAIGAWFRNLLANLAVLPTVLAMVFLAGFLTLSAWFDVFGSALANFFTEASPTPTIQAMQATLASPGPGVMESFIAALVISLVSLVILLMAPKAADIIQSFLSGQPFAYGTALGQAFGPIIGPAQAIPGYVATGARGEAGRRIVEEPPRGIARISQERRETIGRILGYRKGEGEQVS